MLDILPTIDLFSNINLKTGKNYSSSIFIKAWILDIKGSTIELSNGIKIKGSYIYINWS